MSEQQPGILEPRTYGHHQERAAAALNQLLASDVLPIDDVAVDQVRAARAAVVDSMRERLHAMGAIPTTNLSRFEARALRETDPTFIQQRPVTTLDHVVAGLSRPPFGAGRGEDRAVTVGPGTDPAAGLWRQAADDLMLANHALDQAPEQPWLGDAGAAWYLLGDTASTVEAVCVLDDRLREVGVLSDPQDRPDADSLTAGWDLDTRRLVASQQVRMAGWYGTSDAADLAAGTTPRPAVAAPIQPVHQLADVAVAQRRLAGFLQPRYGGDSFSDAHQQMDASTFKTVVANQQVLCRVLADRFTARSSSAAADGVAREFGTRAEVLADLGEFSRRLVDQTSHGVNGRALWQQRELSTGIKRLGYLRGLDARQGLDVATATHQVDRNLAVGTRRECVRDASNLRLAASPLASPDTPAFAHVTRKSPLGRALTAATRMPAPLTPANQWLRPLERTALRSTLDGTPTRSAVPNPTTNPQRPRGPSY